MEHLLIKKPPPKKSKRVLFFSPHRNGKSPQHLLYLWCNFLICSLHDLAGGWMVVWCVHQTTWIVWMVLYMGCMFYLVYCMFDFPACMDAIWCYIDYTTWKEHGATPM